MYRMIICDKDFHFRDEFYGLLEQVAQNLFMECCIIPCKEAEQVEEILKNREQVDLLFLDIESGKKPGFELGKYIRENLSNFHTQIVYVSQEPRYVMQLFETMPFDFLLKPISERKLQSTMKRFLKKEEEGTESFFCYKEGRTAGMLPYNKILYFQSVAHNIVVYTVNGTKTFYGKLDNIEKQLSGVFLRIHKSYIINTHFVCKCFHDSVILRGDQKIPISRSYKKQAREHLTKYVRKM